MTNPNYSMSRRDGTAATHLVGLAVAAEADGRGGNGAAPHAEVSGYQVSTPRQRREVLKFNLASVVIAVVRKSGGRSELRRHSRCEERVRIYCAYKRERRVRNYYPSMHAY